MLCELCEETKAQIYVHENVLELLQKSLTHTEQQQPSEEGRLSLFFSHLSLSVFICPPLSVDPNCPADVDFNSSDMDIKTITSALKFYLRWVNPSRFHLWLMYWLCSFDWCFCFVYSLLIAHTIFTGAWVNRWWPTACMENWS